MKRWKRAVFTTIALLTIASAEATGCGKKNEMTGSMEETIGSEADIVIETDTAEVEKNEETSSDEEITSPETSGEAMIAPFPEDKLNRFPRPDYGAAVTGEWDHTMFLATDLHYLSKELTDGGDGFLHTVEHGDGKVITYIDEITEAFFDTVIEKKPEAVILSGDLTLDGAWKSHVELAEKLSRVERAGIPVLVIPGNHDVNNPNASEYRNGERIPAEYTSPEQFRQIYMDYGYGEAASEDPYSLSYTFDLDPETRFLMIDSCMYIPRAKVGGSISAETYDWIQEQLEDAWDNGMSVIPVAHHNLLDESEIYVEDCSIEHGEQLVDILEEWDVNMFFSGHLHVQHAKRAEENRGVWEMVTSSLATPACQYGVLKTNSNGHFAYYTDVVDVQSWAIKHQSNKQDLLSFDAFKEPFLRRVFYNQAYDELKKYTNLSETKRVQMSQLYSEANYHYYQGDAYRVRDKLLDDPAYTLWQNEGGMTQLEEYLRYILSDAVADYNQVIYK